jgi:hypothetical protein|tara:strand:+ start:3936 stop:4238 length:303 start_codon:yes stop_codon:yes gene_type:complete
MALSENQLVVPALLAMLNSPNGSILTSDLIDHISGQFALDNQDLSPLLNRNDEKYTQIVRNLKSHKTFVKKGFAVEFEGGFRITPEGVDWLEDNGFIPED